MKIINTNNILKCKTMMRQSITGLRKTPKSIKKYAGIGATLRRQIRLAFHLMKSSQNCAKCFSALITKVQCIGGWSANKFMFTSCA